MFHRTTTKKFERGKLNRAVARTSSEPVHKADHTDIRSDRREAFQMDSDLGHGSEDEDRLLPCDIKKTSHDVLTFLISFRRSQRSRYT